MTLFALIFACTSSSEDTSFTDPSKDVVEDELLDWHISVENDERGAFLSAWSPKEDEIWVVGGLPSTGVVLKGNKDIGWTEVALPENTPLLNWIHGTSETDIWVGGLYGSILHWNGSEWFDHSQEVEEAVWGIFVREINDANGQQREVVAVGGESKWGGTIGQIWKYDGENWSNIQLPAEVSTASNLFKVTFDGDKYWIVGVAGTILYGDIDNLSALPTGIATDLITVSPSPNVGEVLIVGGRGTGTYFWGREGMIEMENAQQTIAGLNGVFVTVEKSLMVGEMGYGVMIDSQGPNDNDPIEPISVTRDILHATSAMLGDEETTFYAVGGNLAAANDDYHGVIVTLSISQ